MADVSAPPPEAVTPPAAPDVVGQIQAAGAKEFQAAQNYAGGHLRSLHVSTSETDDQPPESALAPPLGQTFDPGTAGQAKPTPTPPPEAAAVPAGAKPPPKPVVVKQPTAEERDKADADPMGFFSWLVHGGVREAGAGAASTAAEAAQTITLGAGAVASVGDKIWDIATGKIRPSGESYHTGLQDAVFDFNKNVVQPAIEHWKPADDAGPVALGIRQASAMLSAIPYGPAGVAQFVSNTFSNSATNAIDSGADAKAAVTGATVDAVGTGLLMKILGKDVAGRFKDMLPTDVVRRALSAIPLGDLINIGQDLTKKFLLEQNGNDKQAQSYTDKIVEHLTSLEELATNAIFGAVSPHAEKLGQEKPAAPPPEAARAPQPADIPPPPGPSAAAAKAPEPTPAAPAPTVPDRPSVEPAKQIRAQLTDMRRADTPRRGVLITPETQQHLADLPADHDHAAPITNQLEQARTQGRSIQTPVGELIVKTKQDAVKATSQLKAGVDPQVVIGRLTGAGEGKDPSQTVVVQGREMDGSITTERTVRPEDQGAATKDMIDQGKVPVVTTPEGVLAERHVATLDEKQAAEPAKPPQEAKTAPPPEGRPEEISAPAPSGGVEKPQEGFFRTEFGHEVPVHLASEAVEGKIKVRPLNEEGEPQAPIEVPAERVRTGGLSKEAATKEEPANEPTAKGTALDQLPAALAAHERQEQAPTGRKNPASLQERQDNASAFARVLGAAAKEAAEKGRASEPSVRRATEAAKRAKDLTNKSEEATRRGQGTSHAIVATRTREMHRAARELLGKTKEGEEPVEVVEKKPVKPVQLEKPKTRTAPAVVAQKAAAAGAKDTARFHALTDRYLKATDPEVARAAHDELEQHVRAVVGKLGQPPEAANEILRHLQELRAESGRREPPKMSDTLEEEEHEFDRPQEGFQTIIRRSAEMPKDQALKWHSETKRMMADIVRSGYRLSNSDLGRRMHQLVDTGMPMSYHDLLTDLQRHAEPSIAERIAHLKSRVPDLPTFFRSEILEPTTLRRVKAAGLFGGGLRDAMLQVKMGEKAPWGQIVQTILHEGEHATAEFQLHAERQAGRDTGPAAELRSARRILENRLRAKYGGDAIDKLLNYYKADMGASAAEDVPDEVAHLYGITHSSELAAELFNNPKFLQEVIESEKFAQKGENIPSVDGIPGLLHRIITAFAKLLGYDPKLALHILDANLRAGSMQSLNSSAEVLYSPDTFSRLTRNQPTARLKALSEAGSPHDLDLSQYASAARAMAEGAEEKEDLLKEPKPVKAEGAIRALVNSEAVGAARDNVHAIASRSIDMARNTVTALKTMGQIYRDNRGYFGPEDSDANPMNELREVSDAKNKMMQAMRQVSNPVAKAWMRLSTKDNLDVGGLLRDATLWKIDPRDRILKQGEEGFDAKTAARAAEYKDRYDRMSPEAKSVFDGVLKANKTLRGMERRAAVDAAIEGFGVEIDDGQRKLLYGAKDPGAFERLIRDGGLVDVGDKNEKLAGALKDWVGAQIEGPYAHLGRQGDYVVQATPEATKEFETQAEAESFAKKVLGVSPGAKAVAEERGGKWVVDYKVQHVSMHRTRAEAEKARTALDKQGFQTEAVGHKTFTREQAANLSSGMRELMTQALRKIGRSGTDPGTDALMDSLHSAYLQMQAQKSAYAGSQLQRKGFAGVKAKDMRQNFAEHAASSIWHAAQVRTVFQQAAAMARLREMEKTTEDQALKYKRGETVQALNSHAALEARTNTGGAFNRKFAQLGFLSYLTSPAHAAIWMTQNFSTGIPWAGARYGYGRSSSAFARGMAAVAGPAFRRAINEQFAKHASPDDIHEAVVAAIEKHPTMGKWAPQIKELYARGVISHGYANELGALAQGATPTGVRVMDWARVAPAMADAFNRTSTALAGLELTGGDLRKTADMVEAIHANYSAQNKPLAFKQISRVPGGTSLTMFKTYAQEMAHMVYSNLVHATVGADFKSAEGRAKAWVGAKTVAGLMVGNAMFAGVYGAVGLEPIRLLMYAYHKIFDEEGEVWDMKNAIHHFLVDNLGADVGNVLARGPIAAALGVDVQSRMGLANLFFHDPPDLLTSDKDTWKTWVNDEAGPLVQLVANTITTSAGHLQNGEYLQAILSALPVKVVQDGLKALQLLQTGKQTATGAHITEPSKLDAAKQLFGLKPESVADAQEKRGVKSEYTKVQGMVRASIIRQFLAAEAGSPELDAAVKRMDGFNDRNPGAEITSKELKAAERRNEKIDEDIPTKNQRAEEAADFSGRP